MIIMDSYVVLVLIYLKLISCDNYFQLEDKSSFNQIYGVIGAFADFNFDRVTDVVLIIDEGQAIQLLEGHRTEPYLRNWTLVCDFKDVLNNRRRIVGVTAADFTGNSYLDLLVVTKELPFEKLPNTSTDSDSKVKEYFTIWLIKGNLTHFECNSVPLVRNINSIPFTLDFNGDMITDFIVETNACRELWINLKPFCLKNFDSNLTVSYPNSNAFIDLSRPQDFRSDIFIRGIDYFEYWFDIKGFDSSHREVISYPDIDVYEYLGQSTFADINFDGMIDHIIPVCRSGIETCEVPQILVLTQNSNGTEWIEILNTSTQQNLTFIQTNIFSYLDLFVTLRVGDIDSDGYPDFVTLMRDTNTNRNVVVWLRNTKSSTNKFGREFRVEWISVDTISTRQPFLATIFDFEENGRLDILINSIDENNNTYLETHMNKGSSNFLKVFVSSGICFDDCPRISSPLIGSHLCFSPSEGNQVECAGQMSQTQHFALQLPFVLFGLGDVPNFVENLTVSIPSGRLGTVRKQTWYEIIPDSSIVIIPYPVDETDKWIQKLYLDPNIVLPTLMTLAIFCCILVLIIGILHKRDLMRDIIDHREYKKHWL